MNEPHPIETARDADLRLSVAAMHRAALRARELARQTGTAIVVGRRGVVEQLAPQADVPMQGVQEPGAGYGRKP